MSSARSKLVSGSNLNDMSGQKLIKNEKTTGRGSPLAEKSVCREGTSVVLAHTIYVLARCAPQSDVFCDFDISLTS